MVFCLRRLTLGIVRHRESTVEYLIQHWALNVMQYEIQFS